MIPWTYIYIPPYPKPIWVTPLWIYIHSNSWYICLPYQASYYDLTEYGLCCPMAVIHSYWVSKKSYQFRYHCNGTWSLAQKPLQWLVVPPLLFGTNEENKKIMISKRTKKNAKIIVFDEKKFEIRRSSLWIRDRPYIF